MEHHLLAKTCTFATLFALLVSLCCVIWSRIRSSNPKRQPPEPTGSWPLIGHLRLLLASSSLPHIALANLADKYGPIFQLKFGMHPVLVVSNWKLAKECLAKNDKVFVNRPRTLAVEQLGYNSAMFGFSPYGPYWRELRKIVIVNLLSNHKLEQLKHVRIFEVRVAVKALHDKLRQTSKDVTSDGILVELKQWIGNINFNAIVRLIAGKSLWEFYKGEEYNLCQIAIRAFTELSGAFTVSDALPFLRWLDVGGYEKNMKRIAKQLDSILQGWLEEHKRFHSSEKENGQHDFIDTMLDIPHIAQQKPSGFESNTVIKATCLSMIFGGTDTTTSTLIWAVSLLLNNRHVLKKALDEFDTIVGKERLVNDSDMENLVYLQAIIKETMRLYPAAPLSGPREAISDCNISGYHVRAGTRLCINIHKIHRDPHVWSDPCEFRPERFLTTHKHVDVRGQNFELIPFGSGKRICPGISFSLQIMMFTLANLLQAFEIMTLSNKQVDLTERFGLTSMKDTPLEVILTPRLPDELYSNEYSICDEAMKNHF
ncbi:hypothetical protein Nepgr_031474 [Nepenthes gracilis]|uniref:Cytochrome P450 n=1 Tax=Nepenthes gracilis TaxID=150966 RepID=A0AAD3TIL7_NEPGR|nr:hypothetical protein Nepgr_031474 [Nepenthes gracilis]